MRILNI